MGFLADSRLVSRALDLEGHAMRGGLNPDTTMTDVKRMIVRVRRAAGVP